MRIQFDSGPSGAGSNFRAPTEIITARTITELVPALERLEAARRDGFWLTGYASYELGYLFEPRLTTRLPVQRRLPLLRFGAYAHPHQTALAGQTKRAGKRARGSGCAEISSFTPLWDRAAYNDAFRVVRGYIAAGDIYQANLTFPLKATTNTCSESLKAALQPVQHGALVLQGGLPDI